MPPLPPNESARLAALREYQILDTEAETLFNDLVHLAAQICETPIACLGLMDAHREWFKAKTGWGIVEVERDIALADWVMAGTEMLIIGDTLEDERTATNPLVNSALQLRFYAGMPLVNPDGYVLGVLQVFDRHPRSLTLAQQMGLQALGRQVMTQLELKRHLSSLTEAAQNCERIEEAFRKIKDEMDLRVAERTAELVSVNQRLRLELDERRRIEAALRVSQARFAGILEIADDAIISIDGHQRITLFNQGAEKVFGYGAAEVLGKSLDLLLPIRYLQSHRRHVEQFSESPGQARRMAERNEIYGRRKDGTEFPAEASISRLDLGDEKVFTVILRDVSRRRSAEAALESLSRQNELILNSMGEGLCGLNLQGQITVINPAGAKLLGYRVEELIDQPFTLILADREGAPSPIDTALQQGTGQQAIHESFRRKDGSTFPVEYVMTPLREQGNNVGAVITFKDIADRLVVEKMKDEFISVVSHELRTPLTSIHGSLGMLASGLLSSSPEMSQRLLQIAVDSTDRLVRLINDILDIERIESGKVQMDYQICDAADLVAHAVDVMHAMAEKAEVSLSVMSQAIDLKADPDRIIQTLTNLLSNAIKFSPAGETIRLRVERTTGASLNQQFGELKREPDDILPPNPTTAYALFTVADRGRGIPADKIDRIFERFQQVDASDSRNHDGTGLGLAICRSIMQQHNGYIWVESALGEGSTFRFALPLT